MDTLLMDIRKCHQLHKLCWKKKKLKWQKKKLTSVTHWTVITIAISGHGSV